MCLLTFWLCFSTAFRFYLFFLKKASLLCLLLDATSPPPPIYGQHDLVFKELTLVNK
jgi:hypothetical protein